MKIIETVKSVKADFTVFFVIKMTFSKLIFFLCFLLAMYLVVVYTKFVEKSGGKWNADGKKWSVSMKVGDCIVQWRIQSYDRYKRQAYCSF